MDILLVPGFMLDSDLWHDMRGRLGTHGRLVDVDMTSDASIEAMAQRAAASMTGRAVVIGFSMGGYVARSIAYLAPNLVAGLGLIATSARGDDPVLTAMRRSPLAAASSAQRLSRATVSASLHPANRMADIIDRVLAMNMRLGPLVYQRQSEIVRTSDVDRLSEIHCPTAVIASAEDTLRTVEESEELAKGIAYSELTILHGAGHLLPIEMPEDLLDALSPMLDKAASFPYPMS